MMISWSEFQNEYSGKVMPTSMQRIYENLVALELHEEKRASTEQSVFSVIRLISDPETAKQRLDALNERAQQAAERLAKAEALEKETAAMMELAEAERAKADRMAAVNAERDAALHVREERCAMLESQAANVAQRERELAASEAAHKLERERLDRKRAKFEAATKED